MSKIPESDYIFSKEAEDQFLDWFNKPESRFRSEYFYSDCKEKDEKTLKNLMYKWIHVAFVTGFERGKIDHLNNCHKDSL